MEEAQDSRERHFDVALEKIWVILKPWIWTTRQNIGVDCLTLIPNELRFGDGHMVAI